MDEWKGYYEYKDDDLFMDRRAIPWIFDIGTF